MPDGTPPDAQPSTAEGAGTQVTGAQTGTAPQATTAGERQFTQDELNTLLKREREATAKTIKAKADEEAAAAAGKFQELAEQRATRIAEIEPQLTTAQERLTAFEALLEAELKEALKELPDEIRAMQPDGDVLVRRTWLQKARVAAAKLSITRSPGTPSGPRGTGAQTPVGINADDLIAQKRAQVGGF